MPGTVRTLVERLSPGETPISILYSSDGKRTARLMQQGPYRVVDYVDGNTGWEDYNGVVRTLSPEEIGILRPSMTPRQDHAVLWFLTMRQFAWRGCWLGRQRVPQGPIADAVHIDPITNPASDYYFDPSTGLPIARRYIEDVPGRTRPVEHLFRYKDYRRLGRQGYMFYREAEYRDGVLVQITTFQPRRSAVDNRLFLRPSDRQHPRSGMVSFDQSTGRPIVMASVNQSPPLPFLIDTGSQRSIIFKDPARKLHLKSVARSATGFGGMPSTGGLCSLRQVRVGQSAVGPVVVLVPDRAPAAGISYDGILGYDFLGHFQFTVDFAMHQLYLKPRGSPLPTGRLTRLRGHVWDLKVPCTLAHEALMMSVDTGSIATCIAPSDAGVTAGKQALWMGSYTDHAGAGDSQYWVRLPYMGALGVMMHDVLAYEVRDITGGRLTGTESFVGDNFLEHFSLTVDYDRRCIVSRVVPCKAPDEMTQPGIEFYGAPGDGGPKIGVVYPGSPAAVAGLKPRDSITEVDGIPAARLGLWGTRRRLCGAAGSRVTLTFRHESQDRTLTLTRVRLL